MTDETANLILEQLRIIRAEMAALKAELKEEIKELCDRVENLETHVQGLTYIVTTTIGSLVVDMKEVKRRLSALESKTDGR